MNDIIRKEIADGVFFSSVSDSRFKTMRITANIIAPLSAETASENALLCGILARSCKAYPDFTALSRKLAFLYGAEINASVSKMGDRQLLGIAASGLDDRYALDGESISEELSQLLCGVIFEPNLNGESFVEEEVEQERRQLLDVIDSEFNEKRIYANGQMIKHMCEGETFGVKRYGSAEKIKEATPTSLYKAWQKLLETASFEIMYIGDSSPDKAEEVFRAAFEKISRKPEKITVSNVRRAESVKRVTEEMELSQSKLVMGFRTDCAEPDPDVNAERVMCAILGGTASSKLFCNVREKQSLCYYCAARYDRQKGIMVVDSGVEGENIEKAEKGIMKEIEDMQNGVVSGFELDSAKMAIVNSFSSTNDTVGGIDAWYTNQLFDKSFKSVEEVTGMINAVTKDEVVAAAKKLTLDTVYVLKNK